MNVHLTCIGVALAWLAGCATGPTKPPEPSTLFRQGLTADRQGDGVRAEQYIAASLEQGHSTREALPALLEICVRSGRYETALHYARRQLMQTPADWPLRHLAATLAHATGQDERARDDAERVLEAAPLFPDSYFLLGVITNERFGDRRAGGAYLRRYLALAPTGRHAADARRLLRRGPRHPPLDSAPTRDPSP
jgi:tetratricopeptide (TPR) repeat protein